MTECLQRSPAPSSPGSVLSHGVRSPRRSHTTHEYQFPFPTVYRDSRPATPDVATAAPSLPAGERAPVQVQGATPTSPAATPVQENRAPRRPPLGTPRRSHSVMDYEPVPPEHRPCANKTLLDLPGELHMAIFDVLDPIDATCLGLANKHLYALHRRLRGTVPLSARRSGPNDMEWPWYMSGRPLQLRDEDAAAAATMHPSLLRIRGKALCRKCGIYRCELQKHLREWMPAGYEYCSVRDKFGPAATEGAREHCYRSNPNNARRCGRHRERKGPAKAPAGS